MSKGIGGEDGPSVWTFLCVILVWSWVKSSATSAKKSVVDTLEIGKNSAGPFQPETTKDIDKKLAFVDKIPVTATRLKHNMAHYRAIADMCFDELTSWINVDEPRLFAALEHLTVYELRAVAKSFGVRETNIIGFTTSSFTIFDLMGHTLKDGRFGNDLAKMHKIWSKTGLWF